MEFLGIVEVRAGEGTFVTVSPGGRGRDPLTATLYQVWSTQRKLFEVRRILEPGLAALAARRATTEHIEKLRAVLGEQEIQVQQGGTGMKQDTSFHFLIAEATGNEVLLRIVDNLMDMLWKTREASLQQSDRPARSLKQHRAILDAIETRKSAMAERRMREHIRDVEKLVFAGRTQDPAESAAFPPSPDLGVN